MLRATVAPLERRNLADPEDPAIRALDAELRDRAAELATRRGATAENLNQLIQGVDYPGAFADLVAFQLDLPHLRPRTTSPRASLRCRVKCTIVALHAEAWTFSCHT